MRSFRGKGPPGSKQNEALRIEHTKHYLTNGRRFRILIRANHAFHLKRVFAVKGTYSTADLARLFDVNESTVKRWADAGDLECAKTMGGHRRFSVRSVMQFVHQHKLSAPLLSAEGIANENLRVNVIAGNIEKLVPGLKKEILGGNVHGALDIIRTAFSAKPGLLDICSRVVFPALSEIGNEWEARTISIDQEHIATNALKEALTLFQSEIYHKEPNGLTALCACSEGDQHDIAIRCIGYYLETEGWRVTFLGQSTPAKSVVSAIGLHKPDLVALSAAILPSEQRFLYSVNNQILPAARRARAQLVVGGHNLKARFAGRIKADYVCDTIGELASIALPKKFAQQKHGR